MTNGIGGMVQSSNANQAPRPRTRVLKTPPGGHRLLQRAVCESLAKNFTLHRLGRHHGYDNNTKVFMYIYCRNQISHCQGLFLRFPKAWLFKALVEYITSAIFMKNYS